MADSSHNRKSNVRITFKGCQLPPVEDALVVGKHAPVGSEAVVRALQAMSPGKFKLIKVTHPVIESLLIRESDLRKIPEEKLVKLLLENASPVMDESDSLNVTLEVEIVVQTALEDI